ncbi:MAG TPA: hypothetical protein VFK87_01680, partial [Steroidobacteraceae bacterium]|nr:hypothetical protein [Steroidobacteraceae bacterium]
VSSSLPFLASSAVSDAHFGPLNACALSALKPPRTGFAVSNDGTALCAFSGAQTVRCDLSPDGGASELRVPLDGVTAAAFDFDGGLWLAREALYRVEDGGVRAFAQVAPVALAGTPRGAVAVEASGRVVAVEPDGNLLGVAQLPRTVDWPTSLLTSADGERVALIISGGVFVWSTRALKPLRAEAPCAVEAAWWLTEGHRLLLSCGPESDFALEWDVDSGAQVVAPQRKRSRSVLVAGLKLYTQGCEQLACTAAPP